MSKTVTIDGNCFSDPAGFFDEVERNLTCGLDWKMGRNLNAFNDVLLGGFGVHDPEAPLELIWLNSAKSQQDLGAELFDAIVDLIKGHRHISLSLR